MSSVRLEPAMQEKVRHVARLTGMAVSDVHRHALEAYCDRILSRQGKSRYSDGIGIGCGPPDLSSRTREVFADMLEERHDRHPD